MSWPHSEIEWWAVTFSIMDNNDKPIVKVDPKKEKEKLRRMMR